MNASPIRALMLAAAVCTSAHAQVETTREQWWDDRVFYEIFVRSFADSTTGPLAGDGIGDIQGMIEKLDYLNDGDPSTTTDLGVTGIWLMPIHPSPSYHGYDITDYRGIHPEYGTMADFERFRDECHRRGIAVIIDLVLNHTSDKHPWFVEAKDPKSPKRDWYVWAPTDPGWKGPWDQKVWHPSPSGTYFGLFYHGMPDLNFRSEMLTAEVFSMMDYWVRDVRVDGFRLDAIRHLIETGRVQENTPETHAWLSRMSSRLRDVAPRAMTIGEVWSPPRDVAKYIGDELDLCFEFGLADAMVNAAKTGDTAKLREVHSEVLRLYPRGQYGRFLTNHDQPRVMTQLKGDEGKARAAAAMMLLGEGVPFVYYGEEIGMSGDKPDELIRTPMQWTPEPGAGFTKGKPWQGLNADAGARHVEAMAADSGSLLSLYRELIALRNESVALRRGATTVLETSDPGVYAFVRHAEGAPSVMVIVNLGAKDVTGLTVGCETSPLSGSYGTKVIWGGEAATPVATFADHGDLTNYAPGVRVPGYGCVVLVLTRD